MDPTLAIAKENTAMAQALVAKLTALEEENKKLHERIKQLTS